jgi:hypothetical protein
LPVFASFWRLFGKAIDSKIQTYQEVEPLQRVRFDKIQVSSAHTLIASTRARGVAAIGRDFGRRGRGSLDAIPSGHEPFYILGVEAR